MDLANAISAIAAVASAIGGAAAAVAAFRSAGSATSALQAARESEHRAALREIASIAAAISSEVERVQATAQDLHIEYRTAEIFSGSYDHSGFKELRREVSEKAAKAADLGASASLFSGRAQTLRDAPPDDVDRVHVRLSNALVGVRAIREDLRIEHARVLAENAAERERRFSVATKQGAA
jgi:hypothetical protein